MCYLEPWKYCSIHTKNYHVNENMEIACEPQCESDTEMQECETCDRVFKHNIDWF